MAFDTNEHTSADLIAQDFAVAGVNTHNGATLSTRTSATDYSVQGKFHSPSTHGLMGTSLITQVMQGQTTQAP